MTYVFDRINSVLRLIKDRINDKGQNKFCPTRFMSKVFFKRHLPHLHFDEGIYFITSRLYDPRLFIYEHKIARELNNLSEIDFQNHFIKYDSILNDSKTNIDYLKKVDVAQILVNELCKYDNKEYVLIAYTILSNHFHLLFKLLNGNSGISKIMKNIKGRSSIYINRELNRTGKLWQDESYDRWIRDDIELYFVIKYILENPVSAGLVDCWKKWEFTYCKKEYLVL